MKFYRTHHFVRNYKYFVNLQDSVYSGLFPIFPPGYKKEMYAVHHAGKLKVLSEILAQIHEVSEKIVIVSNHTKVIIREGAEVKHSHATPFSLCLNL